MPIPPKPYLIECPKCGYSKVIRPKSDALTPLDLMKKCSRCDLLMKKSDKSVGLLNEIRSFFIN